MQPLKRFCSVMDCIHGSGPMRLYCAVTMWPSCFVVYIPCEIPTDGVIPYCKPCMTGILRSSVGYDLGDTI